MRPGAGDPPIEIISSDSEPASCTCCMTVVFSWRTPHLLRGRLGRLRQQPQAVAHPCQRKPHLLMVPHRLRSCRAYPEWPHLSGVYDRDPKHLQAPREVGRQRLFIPAGLRSEKLPGKDSREPAPVVPRTGLGPGRGRPPTTPTRNVCAPRGHHQRGQHLSGIIKQRCSLRLGAS